MVLSGPGIERPFPLNALLRAGLESAPSGPAIVTLDATTRWAELDAQSRHVARNYLAMGLRPGERVATLMPNHSALIVHHLACLWAGLVSTPLNYRYTAPEIGHALEVSEASLLVHHAERDPDIAASRLAAALPRGRLRFGAVNGSAKDAIQYEQLLLASPADQDRPEIRPGARALRLPVPVPGVNLGPKSRSSGGCRLTTMEKQA
jgi:long-chain acyl-CoA synthetase